MLAKMPALSDPAAKANSPLTASLDRLIRAFEPLRVNEAPSATGSEPVQSGDARTPAAAGAAR
jgi:hypothetical protein